MKSVDLDYPIWHPFVQMKTTPPLKVESASGTVLTLESGQQLLDMVSSWWVTLHGHGHPKIAKAIYDQALKLEQTLFANFTHEPALSLAEKLLKVTPPNLTRIFFSDNGSTSIEVALKMTYQYWVHKGQPERTKFICFEGAYHGDTIGAMSASVRSQFNAMFAPFLFDALFAPYPETFMGDEQCEEKESRALKIIAGILEHSSDQIAGILIEPLIQGAGGMRMCRVEFLQKLQKLAQDYQILIIYDEVMVGFGRTGELFASTKSNTQPDILCLAKGLTGGFLPMALTLCKEEIYQAFYSDDHNKIFFHSHSYSGNPLACAAANASLDLLLETQAFKQVQKMHDAHLEVLAMHAKVSRLRQCGTIIAFDINSGQNSYHNNVGRVLQKICLEQGVYIRPLGNIVYLMPPYCITEEQLALSYQVIIQALDML